MLRSSDSKYNPYLGSDKDIVSIFEEIIIIATLIALASVIRFWKLGIWSFWADEIFSVQDAQQFPNIVTINPAIYMVIQKFTSIFGINEWSARLGPCIIGILGIPFIYYFAKKMFNPRVGFIASLLLAIHPWHIFWSQNARAYSMAFLFSGLAALFFFLALEKDKIILTIISLLFTVLSVSSYLQTVLLIPALAGYVILLAFFPVNIPKGLNEKNLFTYFGPFVLSLLLLFMPTIRSYIYSGWGSNEWGRNWLYILFTLVYSLSIPLSAAALIGGLRSLVYLNRSGLFLICYAIIPLVTILAISPFLNVAGYYLFFTMPAYIILAALCASELMSYELRGSRVLSPAVLIILIFFLLSQSYLYFMVENGGREKWKEAFQTIQNRVQVDDTVVISIPRISEYYLKKPNTMQLEDVISRINILKNSWAEKKQDVWFILDEPSLNILDSTNNFREWLYANCHLVSQFPVYARVMDRSINVWSLTHQDETILPAQLNPGDQKPPA